MCLTVRHLVEQFLNIINVLMLWEQNYHSHLSDYNTGNTT